MASTVTTEEYKRRVADFFDGRQDYNRGDFHARLANRLVEVAGPQPGDRALDVATGTGLVAIPAARLVGGRGRIVGVDISAGMLEKAVKAVEAEGLANVELLLADAESLDYPEGSFDLILCCSALPYMSDIPAALRLWHGLLRSGGKIVFNCWSEASYVVGFLIKEVAARHGIRLPYAELIGSPGRCRAVVEDAGFAGSEVVVEGSGHFVPLEEVERGWSGTLHHPMSHPLLASGEDVLARVHADFLAEARKRATEQGVWDEMTAYFVVGRKA